MKRILRPFAIGLILFAVIAPFLPLLMWSISFRWFFPALLPEQFSLRAWRYLASPASNVIPAFGNSLVVGLSVTTVSILIGIPAGRALGLYKFRGKSVVEFLILAPTIVPTLAVAMGIHVAFIRYGLSDTRFGVILVHLIPVTPYMVLIMASTFANYNVEYEEQARTLGASPVQVFRHVTLPTIFPGLMVASLFAFLISWSQYILTVLIGGGNVITLPMLLFSFATSTDNGITAALSIVFIAPAILFLIVTSRYLTGRSAALGGFGGKF